MNLHQFNDLNRQEALDLLASCCGSQHWAHSLIAHFPFADEQQLAALATSIWYEKTSASDWLEAFAHHPKIGDLKSLSEKFAGKEQGEVSKASMETIEKLAEANQAYESKFGFIFIVCATGKSAEEMLTLLEDRLQNTQDEELAIAMGEQHKITLIRFKKLLPDADWSFLKTSHVTTHVLDTTLGKTGKNICIRLKDRNHKTIAQGRTNNDGRIVDLLPAYKYLSPGTYHMVFDTQAYFNQQNVLGFYPEVDICFTIFDQTHYHVPLLINPFGFSTYRGS